MRILNSSLLKTRSSHKKWQLGRQSVPSRSQALSNGSRSELISLLIHCKRTLNFLILKCKNHNFQLIMINSKNRLGFYVPNLIYLKLDGSLIKCIRDLGTSMQQLEGLWMANCQLQSLSGISIFCKLKRLGVSNNGLSEMNELCFHPNLEDLDFSYN